MANGDDGYVNGGGGGSVWWEVAVSEGKLTSSTKAELREVCPDNRFNPHRPVRPNHGRYMVEGHDSYREESQEENEQGYFEVTIYDAKQISRVELNGDTLKIFLPIDDSNKKVTQYRVTWGIRNKMPALGWAQLKAALESLGGGRSASV